MESDVILRSMERQKLPSIMDQLIALENNWTGIGEQPWKRDNFLMELPNKWDHSYYAIINGKVVGYAICSTDGSILKLNKILVSDAYRGKGIASRLWDEVVSRGVKKGYTSMEFKVHEDNLAAINLYKKKGCLLLSKAKNPDGRTRINCRYIFKAKEAISHSMPSISLDDIDSVSSNIKDLNLATGRRVKEFNTEISSSVGRKYGIGVSSGTAALHIALKSLGVSKGDEVIIPSYVCYGVMSAVLACNATPILADINNNDHNISLSSTRKKITSNTKAIVVADLFGKSVKDIKDFEKLGLPIIEDCAQALGGKHDKRATGSFGIISVLSFNATKMITTGVGGMLLTDSKEIHEKAIDLLKYDQRATLGEAYNYTMSDIQASLGLQQMKKMKEFLRTRQAVAEKYANLIKSQNIEMELPESSENIFYRYVVKHKDAAKIIHNLKSRGIKAESPVFKPLHQYLNLSDESFPNTMKAFNESISLPIYPTLDEACIEEVVGALSNWEQIHIESEVSK